MNQTQSTFLSFDEEDTFFEAGIFERKDYTMKKKVVIGSLSLMLVRH